MGIQLHKKCKKCGADNWSCIDNSDCYYERCLSCSNIHTTTENVYNKRKLVDKFECPECGGLSGHAEENKHKFGIRCDNCGKLFVQFTKADGATDNRTVMQQYPQCPHCGSIFIHKISTTKRVVGVAAFGLASSTIGKTMECKNCGYKW